MSEEQQGFGLQGALEAHAAKMAQQGMRQSPEIGKLAEALAKAQGEITGAKKASKNPHFSDTKDPKKGTYADLASSWDAAREALTKNGLCVIQAGATVDGQYTMRTRLAHSSGQWVEGDVPCIIGRGTNPMQALGSAITYSRRYGFQAITGIAPVDDDGNASGAAPDKVWATEEQAQAWKGPLGKTKLKEQMRALSADLADCSDSSTIAALEHSYQAELEQADMDLPDWAAKARDAIDKKRAELEAKEAESIYGGDEQTALDAG